MSTAKFLDPDLARALCARLTLAGEGLPAIKAVVRLNAGRHSITFTGGRHGEHWLTMTVSVRERVLAHWIGYATQNGYTQEQALACAAGPKAGEEVTFFKSNAWRNGRVIKVGPRRVQVSFKYKHGGAGTEWFPIDRVTRNRSGFGWSGSK